MWTCPKCERLFKSNNQSHMCSTQSIDDLFVGRPDRLVLAFDRLLSLVIDWEPMSLGASTKTIVFTNSKAWLIVRPMSKELDVKFYYHEAIEKELFKKVTLFGKKYAHHLRIRDEEDITEEVLEVLRMGYDFALE